MLSMQGIDSGGGTGSALRAAEAASALFPACDETPVPFLDPVMPAQFYFFG
jgi:hypothetical protein